MIVTLTPNPAVDRTLHLAHLYPQTVNRATSVIREPSGKGVNVALALHRNGCPTTAVLPVGGTTGAELVTLLDAIGVPHVDIPIDGTTRTNVSLIEADGSTTKVNEPGPVLRPDEVVAIVDAAISAARHGDWLAICGSVPAGFSPDDLGAAVRRGRAGNLRVAVDTSGEALSVVMAGALDSVPHLIKPNATELAELTGHLLRTVGEVAEAARVVLDKGVETVLVSLGVDGAIMLDRDGPALFGEAAVTAVVNTVGAGDAFLAGYLYADDRGADAQDRLRSALRFGATAVQVEGTLFRAVDDTIDVSVGYIDPDRRLLEPAG